MKDCESNIPFTFFNSLSKATKQNNNSETYLKGESHNKNKNKTQFLFLFYMRYFRAIVLWINFYIKEIKKRPCSYVIGQKEKENRVSFISQEK